MKKIFANLTVVTLSFLTMIGATYAVFEETVKITNASFTVVSSSAVVGGSNTDLKILLNPANPSQGANLDDQTAGPIFDNVSRYWVEDYPFKLYNKGDKTLDIVSKASYVSDINVLRDDIYVEAFGWDDANGDGLVTEDEIGESFGRDTIMRWRNDTFPLGQLNSKETRGFVLRFDGSGITETNVGMQALFDFEFIGVESL